MSGKGGEGQGQGPKDWLVTVERHDVEGKTISHVVLNALDTVQSATVKLAQSARCTCATWPHVVEYLYEGKWHLLCEDKHIAITRTLGITEFRLFTSELRRRDHERRVECERLRDNSSFCCGVLLLICLIVICAYLLPYLSSLSSSSSAPSI